MATINNVTDTGEKRTTKAPRAEPATSKTTPAEPATTEATPAEPATTEATPAEPATAEAAPAEPLAMPATVQLIAPATPVTQQNRSTTLIAAIVGAVLTALIGGMFLFMVAAFDDVRTEIDTLRNDMNNEIGSVRAEIGTLRADTNARFAEVDRKFDQIQNVLLDHTDRLARIETALGIEGRPTNTANR